MSSFHHTLDIYRAELHLVTTKRDVAALRRKLPFLEEDVIHVDSVGSSGFDVDSPKGTFPVPHLIIWLDMHVLTNEPLLRLVEACAHEASHAASQLFEYLGHDTAGDEPHAYLIGWLTRWMLEQLVEPGRVSRA